MTCLFVLVGTEPAVADPARFWISTSNVVPNALQAPTVPGVQQSARSLHIWAQPATVGNGPFHAINNPFKQLQNFDLNLVADSSVVTLEDNSIVVYNPVLDTISNLRRFQFTHDSSSGLRPTGPNSPNLNDPYQIKGMQGLSIGSGGGFGGNACHPNDPQCALTTDGKPAWLVASVATKAVADSGTGDYLLRIGQRGMSHVNETTGAFEVVFGTDANIVYSGLNHREETQPNDSPDFALQAAAPSAVTSTQWSTGNGQWDQPLSGGPPSFLNNVTVQSGTITVAGSQQANNTTVSGGRLHLSAGSSLASDVTVSANGSISGNGWIGANLALSGSLLANASGPLKVTGVANLSNATLSLDPGYTQSSAIANLVVLEATAGLVGQFTAQPNQLLGNGLTLNSITYSPKSVTIQILLSGATGDINGDGEIDVLDYVVWRMTPNASEPAYEEWRANYDPAGTGGGSAADGFGAAVPEPSAALALCVGAALLTNLPRRRKFAICESSRTDRRRIGPQKAWAVIIGLAATSAAEAQSTRYWDLNGTTAGAGTAPNGTWGSSAAWSASSAGTAATNIWNSGDHAVFSAGSDANGSYTVSVSGTQSAASVLVQEGTITQNAGVINVNGGTFTINAGATWSQNSFNTFGMTVFASNGTLVLNGGTFRQTAELNIQQLVPLGMTIRVKGSGTINYTSSGSGLVTTYGGTITGDGGTTSNGGRGVLIKTGPHEIRYQGTGLPNTTYSKLVVNEGLFRLGFTSSVQDERGFGAVPTSLLKDAITLDGGSIGTSFLANLHANRGITIGPNGGTFNGSGGGLIRLNAPLSGSGTVTLAGGSGGLTLNSAQNINTFSGAIIVNVGALSLNQPLNATNFSGTGGTVNVESLFTVGSANQDSTYAGVVRTVDGPGVLAKVGTGTLTLTGANGVLPKQVLGGTLKGTASALQGTILNNSIVNFDQPSAGNYAQVMSGTGTLLKTAAGALTLSAANTFSGITRINGGSVLLSHSQALQNSTLDYNNYGGTLSFGTLTAASLGGLRGAQNIALTNASSANLTLTIGGTNTSATYSGIISGGGSLTKVGYGTQTLSGNQTYTGGTTINGGVLAVNGSILGAIAINSAGALGGNATVHGNVNSGGRLIPGNSPGTITVNGDYIQSTTSQLEIEVGGTTPGTLHDQVVVNGNVTLNGQLDVPILEGFEPQLNQEITFLTATGTITGDFKALTSPNLKTANPNLELALEVTPGVNDVKMKFVAPVADIQFTATETRSWSDTETWTDGNVPSTRNVIAVQNLDPLGNPQTLQVGATDVAKVHDLTVSGSSGSISIDVQNGAALSATTDITIASGAQVNLDGGSVAGAAVNVTGDGLLAGSGNLAGHVTVGEVNGPDNAVLTPGAPSGDVVGQLSLAGKYTQASTGTLVIDVEGTQSGEFDSLTVSGQVKLGGKLQMVVDSQADVEPGDSFEIITAGDIVADALFEEIEAVGVDDMFLVVDFAESALGSGASSSFRHQLTGTLYSRGDMNHDRVVNPDDIPFFALALSDPAAYYSKRNAAGKCICDFGQTGGDLGGATETPDGRLDYDDVPYFAAKLNMSTGMLFSIMMGLPPSVPEPTSATLLFLGSVLLTLRRRHSSTARFISRGRCEN